MTGITTIRRNALRSLVPPQRIALSEWIEANISAKRSQHKGPVDPGGAGTGST